MSLYLPKNNVEQFDFFLTRDRVTIRKIFGSLIFFFLTWWLPISLIMGTPETKSLGWIHATIKLLKALKTSRYFAKYVWVAGCVCMCVYVWRQFPYLSISFHSLLTQWIFNKFSISTKPLLGFFTGPFWKVIER